MEASAAKSLERSTEVRAEALFQDHRREVFRRTDRLFAGLMVVQWIAGLAIAAWVTPLTWAGGISRTHPHVWGALILGSAVTVVPVLMALFQAGSPMSRHSIAVGQMMWSALFIHLTGGRIETHFHVFGSLAFLAFYRDWRVLLTATVVVAADHFFRGLYWPESVYGTVLKSQWRWLEHAAWVIFENVILVRYCVRGVLEMREVARRQAESEASSEKKYETLVNSVEGVVWEADADTLQFRFVSRQAEKLLGYPQTDWINSPSFLADRLHPDDRSRVLAHHARHVALRKSYELEYRLTAADGRTVWVQDSVTIIAEEGRAPLCRGVKTDITERQKIESLKSDFISTVSHELRTPLTSIRGSLGLIASGVTGALPPKTKTMVDIACKNSERLVHLVNDILDIQKIESGKMTFDNRPCDLVDVTRQAVEANRAYASGLGVDLRFETAPGAMQVLADSGRLIQVLTNLISNAAKFSPKGDAVRVALGPAADGVRISVADHGPGIPEAFRARIFQKFAQADGSDTRQRQGTGLGLSISKAIIEKLGGRIGFDTRDGKGTVFHVDLPLLGRRAEQVTRDVSARPRILICEDEPDIATILRATLETMGYDSDIATNAQEAKELLPRRRYEAMTLDLGLPDQDGISLIKELREEAFTRNLPIVVVSAYVDEGKRILNGSAFGVVDWLEKPISEAQLDNALKQAVNSAGTGKPRILHVEDEQDIQHVVQLALDGVADVACAGSLAQARGLLKQEDFDLVILDIGLPDGSGLELLPALSSPSKPSIPVLLFSAQEVSHITAKHVAGVLRKSSVTNQELVDTITSLISHRAAGVPRPALQPVA